MPMFFVDVLATDIVQNFLKHIQKAHFQGGSVHIFNFFLGPSWAEKICLESDITDPRGFTMVKTSRINVVTF